MFWNFNCQYLLTAKGCCLHSYILPGTPGGHDRPETKSCHYAGDWCCDDEFQRNQLVTRCDIFECVSMIHESLSFDISYFHDECDNVRMAYLMGTVSDHDIKKQTILT